ncbi:MAG: hypothetical protein SOZ92_04000 [Porphyromonas somerae]|nr:hypothetical protein [Porphyromonas somerae]MDY3884484.1 hypothetical protein [Porphyromonas somerae]
MQQSLISTIRLLCIPWITGLEMLLPALMVLTPGICSSILPSEMEVLLSSDLVSMAMACCSTEEYRFCPVTITSSSTSLSGGEDNGDGL